MNDIFRVSDIKWTHDKKRVLGKVEYFKMTPDGLEIHVKRRVNDMPVNDCSGFVEFWFPAIGEERSQKVGHHMKDIEKLVITRGTKEEDKNTVYCRAYDKDGLMAMSKAICAPDDIFDFNIGAKLAVDRMYASYDMTPKPKRKLYNGYIIFIDSFHDDNSMLNGNCIYKVVDGLIPDLLICGRGKQQDLRIEEKMTCSALTQRVRDMYFLGSNNYFNKVMYTNVSV